MLSDRNELRHARGTPLALSLLVAALAFIALFVVPAG
jgi:hypothetical protein